MDSLSTSYGYDVFRICKSVLSTSIRPLASHSSLRRRWDSLWRGCNRNRSLDWSHMLLYLFIFAKFLLEGRRSSRTCRCGPDRRYIGPYWSLLLRWSHWARLRYLSRSWHRLDLLTGLRRTLIEYGRVWLIHSHRSRHSGGRVHFHRTRHSGRRALDRFKLLR